MARTRSQQLSSPQQETEFHGNIDKRCSFRTLRMALHADQSQNGDSLKNKLAVKVISACLSASIVLTFFVLLLILVRLTAAE
jgi:hypothetical protein